MRLNILIGGKAGQGINKISEIISKILIQEGYFVFNYRDYPSLIRGGHNFNIISISDKLIGSFESKMDVIVALDENTIAKHKDNLKADGLIVSFEKFQEVGRNLNIVLSGALIKILGINKQHLIAEIKKQFNNDSLIAIAERGYDSQNEKCDLQKIKQKISLLNGSEAVSIGAINSGIDFYFAYPMTPATGVMNALAKDQLKNHCLVFQNEDEIAAVNAALGASFTGAKVMVGTSGGGFDLMTEGFSLQGQLEIPLVVYLASRAASGTGLPTYSGQTDLDVALKGGHGEFTRVVIAPGDPVECIEKTNEAFYLAHKYNCLSIILSDKHLAESEFSFVQNPNPLLKINSNRKLPGKNIVKVNSYEHDQEGNTIEDPIIVLKNVQQKKDNLEKLNTECSQLEMFKIHGDKKSVNLIVSWGSSKPVILDALDGEEIKFLQILYLQPFPTEIKKELEKAEKIILIEQNVIGQLGNLIREKTGIEIKDKILKYDGRPFTSDELKLKLRQLLALKE